MGPFGIAGSGSPSFAAELPREQLSSDWRGKEGLAALTGAAQGPGREEACRGWRVSVAPRGLWGSSPIASPLPHLRA